MYEYLKKHIENVCKEEKENSRFYILHGYCTSWNPAEHKESENGLERYSTPAAWNKYKAGTYTKEKAEALALRRMEREKDKYYNRMIEKVNTAANANDLLYASISIEWIRNTTWGNNPHAEIRTNVGYFEGRASGCGYDKESAAVCTALNGSYSALKLLYAAADEYLKNNPGTPTNFSWGNVINYGAGYGAIPYFEGGVGMSSILGIFKKLGYTAECTASGRKFDVYNIERKEA